MFVGPLAAVGMQASSVTTPAVVILANLLARFSVNQRLPSGPAMMPWTPLAAVGTGNFVIAPVVVMRPISLLPASVNQRFPSGPVAMSSRFPVLVTGNSVRTSLPGALGT